MTYSQEGYRFRNDDQGELGASWLDTQDAPQIMSWRGAVYEPVGFGAFTPRRAGINVPAVATTPIFIAAHIRPFALRTETVISRFDAAPERSCYFLIRSDGALMFGYSQNGTAVVDIPSTVAWFSPVHSYPIKLGQSFWVGVWHGPQWDVVRQTRFFVAPTRETLMDHQLGATVDFGANGIIYDSNAAWYLTLRIDGGFHFSGDIYSVEAYANPDYYDGFDGTLLLNPNFADPKQGWRPGMSGEATPMWGKDDVGNVWTLSWHHVVAGGIRKETPIRVRTLLNATGTPSSYAAAVAAAAPLAHWRFSGVGTADSAGAHTLTLGGGATPGVAGVWAGDEAVSFDGVDDFATIANEVDLELVSDMSIEMWVRPHDPTGSGQTLLSCRASGDPLYEITYGPDTNNFTFYPYTSAGSGMTIGNGVDNQWHHIVVTIDWIGPTNRTLKTYFNGALTQSLTPGYLPAPVSPVISIGRRSVANDTYFDGDISELAIYPSVLSAAQVLEHYRGGLTLMYKRVDEPDTEWREV